MIVCVNKRVVCRASGGRGGRMVSGERHGEGLHVKGAGAKSEKCHNHLQLHLLHQLPPHLAKPACISTGGSSYRRCSSYRSCECCREWRRAWYAGVVGVGVSRYGDICRSFSLAESGYAGTAALALASAAAVAAEASPIPARVPQPV